MEQDDWDTWRLSKEYSLAQHVGDNDDDYMAEIYKQITKHRHRLEVESSISNTKPKIKVDVSHMSKDVGADILQRVKQAYEDKHV